MLSHCLLLIVLAIAFVVLSRPQTVFASPEMTERPRKYVDAHTAKMRPPRHRGQPLTEFFLQTRIFDFAPVAEAPAMPLFGAHMSIAGGLHNALVAAKAHGMDTVQLFTASPQTWPVSPLLAEPTVFQSGKLLPKNNHPWHARELSKEEVRVFQKTLRKTRLRFPTAHTSYLINLASPEEKLYRRSIEAFIVEVQRAEQLGLKYLVTHPGAHVGSGEETGLQRVAEALNEVHQRCPGFRVQVLLETTAGQGTCLGHRFEHLADILARVDDSRRLGVCLDTCHVFAAGYALVPESEYQATLRAFNKVIGLSRLKAFHINDSLKPLGSRVDRHAHLGQGCLGVEPFRLLVNDSRFRNKPMILETPKEETKDSDMDTINLGFLRGLAGQGVGR